MQHSYALLFCLGLLSLWVWHAFHLFGHLRPNLERVRQAFRSLQAFLIVGHLYHQSEDTPEEVLDSVKVLVDRWIPSKQSTAQLRACLTTGSCT